MYSHRIFEKEDESKRISFLYHLVTDDDFIGLFPLAAIDHPLFPPALLTEKSLGGGVRPDHVPGGARRLSLFGAGYEPAALVRGRGDFAKRGAIVDVFPPSSAEPVRIEFLGDQVYSLRFFDPGDQRSQREIERAILIPASLAADKGITIIDYLPARAVVVHKGLETSAGRSTRRRRADGACGKGSWPLSTSTSQA